MPKKQKLELTWIGKENQARLEPRILIEDVERSFGDKNAGNMLIHGDNLLALKALEHSLPELAIFAVSKKKGNTSKRG